MKELVGKKRRQLEDVCASAHMRAPSDTTPEKTDALIEAGEGYCLSVRLFVSSFDSFSPYISRMQPVTQGNRLLGWVYARAI